MSQDPRYPPIGDYALIGDCRAAALISRAGSIDWLCLPRFDSPSVFAAILDADIGGRFLIQPTGEFHTTRRYVQNTNVLETTFLTDTGKVVLRDCMPVMFEEEKQEQPVPQHELLRELQGIEGEVEFEVRYEPHPDYARARAKLGQRGQLGIWCDVGYGALALCTEIPLVIDAEGDKALGKAIIHAGERRALSLTFSEDAPGVIPSLGDLARQRSDSSIEWWRGWAARCTYDGLHRDLVVRSALALKLLTYAPSGAIVAAPTTSLPEAIGGVRNWDYRYCWLRDAAFTLRALVALGFRSEAEAFLSWVLHTTRITEPEVLQVVYDVYGEPDLSERDLPHLEGYAGSRPVRIGNGAHDQFQLDVYGEVVEAAARFADGGGAFDSDTAMLLSDIGRVVCQRWREPDDGIWESRAGRFHYTHSKVLCWVALDRLIRMHETGQIRGDARRFREERDAIRNAIEENGYNEKLQSYTRVFGGYEVDGALLVLPLYGYIDAKHPRMRSTLARIRAELGDDSLIYRYRESAPDGLPPGEGAFGICGFWAVECMALGGELGEADRTFGGLLAYGNDLGLFSEEHEPGTGLALGNYPQAFTHVGLINAALTLAQLMGQHGAEQSTEMRDLAIEDSS